MLAVFLLYICTPDRLACRWVPPAQDRMSLMECLTESQASAAKWANEHPNWVVAKTRCQGTRP